MATSQATEKAPTSRLIYLVALLAVAVVSAAAFGRVFQGSGPPFRLGIAAAAAIVLAVALERRHVLIATVVSAIGLAFAIGFLLFPATLWHHLPTASTLRAAGNAWSRIGDIARTEVAPARPLAPLFLAGLTAVWAAAFSAHALAVRARSPFLALLPPGALLGFPSILLNQGARPLYVLVFLLAALGLLFADAIRRVGQWGPITMWQGRHRFRLGTVTTRGARWLGVWCVGIAVLIPGILPGYRRPGAIDVHSATSGLHVSIDPLVYIQPQLLRSDPIPLFTVTASEPSYWRFAALDSFDGKLWNSKNLDLSTGQDVGTGPLQSDLQLDPSPAAIRIVDQTYDFQLLSQDWLPAAYDPIDVTTGTTLRYDPRASMLVEPDGTHTGFTYRVKSRVITPAKQLLDEVPSLDSPEAKAFLSLPTIPQRIVDLAHRLTDDKPNPYEKILAIQNYLRGFKYDINAPAGHDVNHMEYFLFTSKAGYCEQFAGTMAVMLRAIGIPARVAVGFTPGSPTPEKNKYQVTTENAHAWVEVLFPKYGWLGFEPTPTRRNPATAPFDFPVTFIRPSGGGTTCSELSEHGGPGGVVRGDPCETGGTQPPVRGGGRTGQDEPGTTGLTGGGGKIDKSTSWRVLVLEAGLLAALLLLAAIPVTKAVRRRRVVKRARMAGDRVLAAYSVLVARAADLGLGRGAAETVREYRARLQDRIPGLPDQFDRLTGLVGRAAYSVDGVSEAQAEQALVTAHQSWRVIRRSAAPSRRVLAWFSIDRPSRFRWVVG